jgi:hypothetical protein
MKDEFLKILKIREASKFDFKKNIFITAFKIYSEDLKDITKEKNKEIFNVDSDMIKIEGSIKSLGEILTDKDYIYNYYISEENLKNDLSEEIKKSNRLDKIKELIDEIKMKELVIFTEIKSIKKIIDKENVIKYFNAYRVTDQDGKDITDIFLKTKIKGIRVAKSTGDLLTSRQIVEEFFSNNEIKDKLKIVWKTKKQKLEEIKKSEAN